MEHRPPQAEILTPGLRKTREIVCCQPPRAASTLNLPPPTAAIYRNRKQYSTAASPPLPTVQRKNPRGACASQYANAINPEQRKATGRVYRPINSRYPAKHFNRAGYATSGKQFERGVGFYREAEHLLRSVLQKHECRNDSGDPENLAGIFFELGLNGIDHCDSLSGLSPVLQIVTSWQGRSRKTGRAVTGTIYTLKRRGSNRVSRP